MKKNDKNQEKEAVRKFPPKTEYPHTTPIWCGYMSEEKRQFIMRSLKPNERQRILFEEAKFAVMKKESQNEKEKNQRLRINPPIDT